MQTVAGIGRIALLTLSLFVSVYGGECRLDIPLQSTCDPYRAKLLSVDKVEYLNRRTPISQLHRQYDSDKPSLFSLSYWVDRYLSDEPPVRFRGTAKVVSSAIEALKARVDHASKMLQDDNRTQLGKLSEILTKSWGYYKVEPGDTIAGIASKFHLKQKEILTYNRMKATDILRIGQKLILPLAQETIDVIATGRYRIRRGDSLIGVAKRFGLDPNEIATLNHIKHARQFYAGRVIDLPFAHIKKRKWLQTVGTRKLRVTATAYTSHRSQTDKTPFIAAWNNRLRPGMKAIAVSRDLIAKYGLTNGTKVKISGLPGYYTVRDKMNKRYRRRIDIYMGTDRRRALRWGRRSVVIYF